MKVAFSNPAVCVVNIKAANLFTELIFKVIGL